MPKSFWRRSGIGNYLPLGLRALPRHLAWALALGIVASTSASQGFYVPRSFGELMQEADLIVAGTIAKVEDDHFCLAVERALAGGGAHDTLWVEPFEPPEANPRWAPYEAGQGLVLFLSRIPVTSDAEKAEVPGGRWRILGTVGEGEISLHGSWAYFHGRNISVLERATFELAGRALHIQRFDRSLTLDALVGLAACVDWKGYREQEEPSAEGGQERRRICPESEWIQYRHRSILHEHLAKEVR